MHFLMRKLAAFICLFTLAACGQPAAPVGEQPPQSQADNGSVMLSTPQGLPDWLLVLRTTEGGTVHFNQRTVTRENGFADIWLQVRYGHTQAWDASDEGAQRTIRFDVERMHYRFNCADGTFVIVERQIMGSGDDVVARDNPQQIYRRTPSTGVAAHMMPIACRGA